MSRGNEPTRLVVVGQGYVGLPLALRAVEAGFDVVGFDIDAERIKRLAAGDSYVEDVPDDRLAVALDSGRFEPAHDPERMAGFDVAVLDVPTPLRDGMPNLSHVEDAASTVSRFLRSGALVVLESTSYPGTTEELVGPILEKGSGLVAGSDFRLAYSPERIDPGNHTWRLDNTPKVVSGVDEASLEAVQAFYGRLVEQTVPVSGTREAELTKLLENTFRHVNIALVNELAMFAAELDIDVWEAIDAATTKPFGYLRFTPGPGVGGHCLPIDPSYLSWKVRRSLGQPFRFVELANDVNEHMPDYLVRRLVLAFNRMGRSVNGSRILLLGLAYKRNTGDAREAPGAIIAQSLRALGAEVRVVDPHIAADSASVSTGRADRGGDRGLRRHGDRDRSRCVRLRAGPDPRLLRLRCPEPAVGTDGRAAVACGGAPRADASRRPGSDDGAVPVDHRWWTMRVVVTGGAGFIGANLCRALTADPAIAEVVALDDLSTGHRHNLGPVEGVDLVEGSILDRALLDRVLQGADAVVHLAARPSVPRSMTDPMASHLTNATGTMEVLEAARRGSRPHIVVASSSSVYGANPTLPKREDMATMPASPYAAGKLAAEAATLAYGRSFGLPVLAFRFFNVFGPLQSAGHAYAAVVPAFIDAALRGEPLPVHGDGAPDPGLHLCRERGRRAARRPPSPGDRPRAGQSGLRDQGLAPRAHRAPREAGGNAPCPPPLRVQAGGRPRLPGRPDPGQAPVPRRRTGRARSRPAGHGRMVRGEGLTPPLAPGTTPRSRPSIPDPVHPRPRPSPSIPDRPDRRSGPSVTGGGQTPTGRAENRRGGPIRQK